jgi:hypothetical protein
MAINAYSNLYGLAPNGEGTQIFRGPWAERVNHVETTAVGSIAITADTTLGDTADQVEIMRLPAGAKLTRIVVSPGADLDTDNDFTFNLGTAGTLTAYASASTGLQATTAFSASDTVLANAAAVAGHDDYEGSNALLLSRQAGELEVSGTLNFIVSYTMP